jgi:hypothetical protein
MVSGRKSSVSNLAPRKSSVALPSGLLKSYEVGDGPVERIDQIGKDTKATARARHHRLVSCTTLPLAPG